jgi:hypothetical protein
LGLKLVTIGELDARREESPELIGSEAVEDIGEAGKMFWAKELELPLGRERHVDARDSQGLNLSLEERVRRKLILAGILPKLSDLGQARLVRRQRLQAPGSSEGFIRRLSMTAAFEMTLETLNLNRSYYLSEVGSEASLSLSLTARDASTKGTGSTKTGLDAARKRGCIGERRPKLRPEQQDEIIAMVSRGAKTAADAVTG